MMANTNLSNIAERKSQVGYQSHLIERINDLAATSLYRSRNDFLDATVQILDDLERFTLESELRGRFGRDEILLLGSVFKTEKIDFYPNPRYKSLVFFKVSQVLEHGKIDRHLSIDQESMMATLDALTEFQAYTLLLTIRKASKNYYLAETALFTALNPNDFGFLIMARSSIPLYKADLMACRDPEDSNYILAKRYSIDDAKKEVQFLESKDREEEHFKEDQYVVFDIGKE